MSYSTHLEVALPGGDGVGLEVGGVLPDGGAAALGEDAADAVALGAVAGVGAAVGLALGSGVAGAVLVVGAGAGLVGEPRREGGLG